MTPACPRGSQAAGCSASAVGAAGSAYPCGSVGTIKIYFLPSDLAACLFLFVSVSRTPSQICTLSSTLILPLRITPAITGRKCEHRGFGGSRAATGSKSIAFVRHFFQETLSIPL